MRLVGSITLLFVLVAAGCSASDSGSEPLNPQPSSAVMEPPSLTDVGDSVPATAISDTASQQATASRGMHLKEMERNLLSREEVGGTPLVRHILVAWRSLSPAYAGKLSEAAAKRTRNDAELLLHNALEKVRDGVTFTVLIDQLSEDRSTLNQGDGYRVTPTAGFVPPFKRAASRLNPGETGVVESVYGWHLMQRLGTR